jgi:hypothetical protein
VWREKKPHERKVAKDGRRHWRLFYSPLAFLAASLLAAGKRRNFTSGVDTPEKSMALMSWLPFDFAPVRRANSGGKAAIHKNLPFVGILSTIRAGGKQPVV